MTNQIIIIGTEKTIKPFSSWWILDSDISVVSAYGYNSRTADREEYFVESCSILNPNTGCARGSNFFENVSDFERDRLYDDIERLKISGNAVSYFCDTFPGHGLTGSEFAVALMAQQSEQRGYTPLIVAQPDEKNLIEFCKEKKWTYLSLGESGPVVSQDIQKIISSIVTSRSGTETQIFSSNKNF